MNHEFFKKRRRAFACAFRGINSLFAEEVHPRIHLVAAVCVIAFGFIFNIAPWEWCAVIICMGGVFMAEAFNTALERLADRVTRERDPLIRVAKDVAAAAVLLFVFASVAVGLIVFIPKFLS